jgi:hypothetical protein
MRFHIILKFAFFRAPARHDPAPALSVHPRMPTSRHSLVVAFGMGQNQNGYVGIGSGKPRA